MTSIFFYLYFYLYSWCNKEFFHSGYVITHLLMISTLSWRTSVLCIVRNLSLALTLTPKPKVRTLLKKVKKKTNPMN